MNERSSITKTEVGQNYNITKNLNSKKISDPGKNNNNLSIYNQPIIRYKKNTIHQLLKQLDFLKKKNEYSICMGSENKK